MDDDLFGAAAGRAKAEVADKVRKLLAKAEDPAATPEEAQACTEKAQQLMTKYAISLAMVADAGAAEAMVLKSWVLENPYATHKVTLVNVVARANDCRAIYGRLSGGRKAIDVMGYPGDVEWVETLARSLEVQMASALAAGMAGRPQGVHGRTYAVGFIHGFIGEVAGRLMKARRAAVAEAEAAAGWSGVAGSGSASGASASGASAGSSVALVLVAKEARVEEEFQVRFPGSRAVHRSIRLQSWSGYRPGQEAGRRASIARGHLGGSGRSLSA